MSQRLTIHQFGSISDLEIDIDDILVFIGSQASGKSTVSKAIFFFKSLRDDLYQYYNNCYQQNQFDRNISNFGKLAKKKFINLYGSVLQSPNMQLTYVYGEGVSATVRPSDDNRFTKIEFSRSFSRSFNDIMSRLKSSYDEIPRMSSSFSSYREVITLKANEANLFAEVDANLNTLFGDDRDIVFLPAGRSLITILSQQIQNIDRGNDWSKNNKIESDGLTKLDYLMGDFINRIDNIKPIFEKGMDKLIEEHIVDSNPDMIQTIYLARDLVNSILRGSYSSFNGIERITFADGKSTLMNFASSGQQEVVWILLFILILILKTRKVFLVVEEPEAHLFPVAQKQIIDLISLLANQNDNQILLTTHSPYILSSFNNLLYAHNVGREKPDAVAQVVDPHLWIDCDRLNAYILEDGTARTIVDRSEELIQSAEIDRASNIIIDTFNQLFDLED